MIVARPNGRDPASVSNFEYRHPPARSQSAASIRSHATPSGCEDCGDRLSPPGRSESRAPILRLLQRRAALNRLAIQLVAVGGVNVAL